MANQDAYKPIATQTVSGSSTSSVTFSSISGSYTDLILIINGATSDSATNNFRVRFNSDSATNYSATRLLGDGSSTSTATGSNNYMMLADINNALLYNYNSFYKPWLKGYSMQWKEEKIWSYIYKNMNPDNILIKLYKNSVKQHYLN